MAVDNLPSFETDYFYSWSLFVNIYPLNFSNTLSISSTELIFTISPSLPSPPFLL